MEFPVEAWVVLGLVAAVAVMGMLQAFAGALRDETDLHDLHVDVASMRNRYKQSLLEREEYTPTDVIGTIGSD